MILGNVDRSLGNAEGWGKFQVKSLDQGAATHVFAAFEPSLKGQLQIFFTLTA